MTFSTNDKNSRLILLSKNFLNTNSLWEKFLSQTCKHIAERLMWMLMSPDVKAISNGALDQFNLDIIQCEVFSAKDLVEGLDKDTLSMAFAELRYISDFFFKYATFLII